MAATVPATAARRAEAPPREVRADADDDDDDDDEEEGADADVCLLTDEQRQIGARGARAQTHWRARAHARPRHA